MKCQMCGLVKPDAKFKKSHRDGRRDKLCRACRAAKRRLTQKRTPPNVKRTRGMGAVVDPAWSADRCLECGELLSWDTDGRGGLVALDLRPRTPHRHQPEEREAKR